MLELKRWWRTATLVILLVGLTISLVHWFFADDLTAWRDDQLTTISTNQ